MISPLLPMIEDELHLSHALSGSLFGFLTGGYTISLILSGFLSRRFGLKRVITVGFVITSAIFLLMPYATNYLSLALFMTIMGIGTGTYRPNLISFMTQTVPPQKWGITIALNDSAICLSIILFPILTTLALRFFVWRTLFLMMGGVCLICVTAFSVFSQDPRPPEEEIPIPFLDILRRRDFQLISIVWMSLSACSMGLYSIVPLFLVKEKGIPFELANTLLGISRVGSVFLMVLAGVLSDRFGVKRILFLTCLLTGISTMGLALANGFPLLIAMLILQATASDLFFPSVALFVSRITRPNERSLFAGLAMAFAMGLGHGLAPVFLGVLADLWNFQSGILFLGVMATLSCFSLKGIQEP